MNFRCWPIGIALTVAACGSAPSAAVSPTNASQTLAPLSFTSTTGAVVTIPSPQRITVVDVWASYCKPCRAAFPKLNTFSASHPNVTVIGISVDEDASQLQQFLREVPATFTIAQDPTLSVKQPPLLMKSLPTLLVIDDAGRIRFRADEAKDSDYDALPSIVASLIVER
jgi:cytochrome c biogenesis protein CcmG, thiol:disulfide interchange protein DsbE